MNILFNYYIIYFLYYIYNIVTKYQNKKNFINNLYKIF